MDIWFFLLVFCAILIGWLLGRWQPFAKNSGRNDCDEFNEDYVKGLNYLLTDDSDNAIKVFTNLIEVNKDTIEIHVALGNLFRSKGEVDRAIKVHQNLLARPNLTRKQRHMAISELASDYLKAGLLDRAEQLYREMIELNSDVPEAHKKLLDLFIIEKSWLEAADSAETLFDLHEPGINIILSQCLCEIADTAIESRNIGLARKTLKRAIDVDHKCVRASLLFIKVNLSVDDSAAAEKIFQRLCQQSPEYLELYLEPAKQIYTGKSEKVYQQFLHDQYQTHHSTPVAIALLEYYADHEDIDKAQNFLSDILLKSPSFEAFEFALRFLKSNPDQLDDTWERLSAFLKTVQSKKSEFNCGQCGYESHSMQWLCPSCRNWASMKPV
ncbi:MAG: lipopolysaccharide biosynthesis regulator YciM [Gammaproteobacteria bacterium]